MPLPAPRRALLAAALLPGTARAQDQRGRAIRLVLGFPPGSAADLGARVVAPALAAALGQPVLVENRPGAGSNIATAEVARAAPDGLTILLGSVANTINASLSRDLAFDFARDFVPVAPLVTIPNILVVHPSLPANTVAESAWRSKN